MNRPQPKRVVTIPLPPKQKWEETPRPEKRLPGPPWLREGVRCVSSHESVAFLRRRGGCPVNVEEIQERNYSEETVKRLAERGIDMIVVHGYKGFGLKFEKQELERTRRTAAACRKHGLKLGLYCQVASIFPETFFKDYPQGREWICRDYRGEPFYYADEQTYRVFPCYRTPGFREYFKGVLRYLVKDLSADFMHFDNTLESVEPHSCHCVHCRAAFTAFLRRRYGGDDRAAQRTRVERFSFDDLDAIEPPLYTDLKHPGLYEEVRNPVLQEWIRFRCETITDFVAMASAYVRQLNPNVGVEANPSYFPGRNRIRHGSTFVPWLAPSLDIVFNEDQDGLPRFTEKGVVGTNIRAYKIARGQGIGCFGGWSRNVPDAAVMTAAERLAFSPDFSWWVGGPAAVAYDDPPELQYIQFYRANKDLYHDTRVVADVTLLRSFETQANRAHFTNLISCIVEQDLIEARIPWVTVSDEALDHLQDTRVLLLPQVECVSEWMAGRLMEFVRAGGALVMTGDTGRYDEWRRPWPQPILAKLLGEATWPKRPKRWRLGSGRAAYLPEIVPQTPLHLPPLWDQAYLPIDSRYWLPAKNHAELLAALKWAAGGRFSAEVSAPRGVCCEFVRQGEQNRPIIHFVNLRKEAAGGVKVRISRELAGAATHVELRSPHLKKSRVVKLTPTGTDLGFRIPPFERYMAAVLV